MYVVYCTVCMNSYKMRHAVIVIVYRARPISLAYWKLELGHREKREIDVA